MAKLKVYCTAAGFYDAIVAAPSQRAALRAWGTTTDLFAAGRASVLTGDEAAASAALASPGEVIRRARGTEAELLGPEPPARSPGQRQRRTRPDLRLVEPAPRPPDRSGLDAAEKALAEAEHEIARIAEAFVAERAELDRRGREAREAGEARLAALRADRDQEEEAFVKAGGRLPGKGKGR